MLAVLSILRISFWFLRKIPAFRMRQISSRRKEGFENAALINESGLYFEQYIEMLKELAAQAQ